jgi:hypothetical protein
VNGGVLVRGADENRLKGRGWKNCKRSLVNIFSPNFTTNFQVLFQASAAMLIISALFWDITRSRAVIVYRRFGITCRSHLHGSRDS